MNRLQRIIDHLAGYLAAEMMIAITGAVSILLGLAVTAQAPVIAQSPTFNLALTILPGWAWGAMWMVGGTATLAGLSRRSIAVIPAICLALVYLGWCVAVFADGDFLWTAPIAYWGLSLAASATAILATARRRPR